MKLFYISAYIAFCYAFTQFLFYQLAKFYLHTLIWLHNYTNWQTFILLLIYFQYSNCLTTA